MELVNVLYQVPRPADDDRKSLSVIRETMEVTLLLLNPIVPHFAEELWQLLGQESRLVDMAWPGFDPTVASEEEITIVIQINGKVRSRITVGTDEDEAAIKALARDDDKIAKYLSGKAVIKEVYVPKKLVNIVIKEG